MKHYCDMSDSELLRSYLRRRSQLRCYEHYDMRGGHWGNLTIERERELSIQHYRGEVQQILDEASDRGLIEESHLFHSGAAA